MLVFGNLDAKAGNMMSRKRYSPEQITNKLQEA